MGDLGSIQHPDFQMAVGEMTSEEFTDFLLRIFGLLAMYRVDGGFSISIWTGTSGRTLAGGLIYSELKNICVRVKDNAGIRSLYRSHHEFVFVYKQGNAVMETTLNWAHLTDPARMYGRTLA